MKNAQCGFVYGAESKCKSILKVGFTDCPWIRESCLRDCCSKAGFGKGKDFRIFTLSSGTRDDEKAIKRAMTEFCIIPRKSEWFTWTIKAKSVLFQMVDSLATPEEQFINVLPLVANRFSRMYKDNLHAQY